MHIATSQGFDGVFKLESRVGHYIPVAEVVLVIVCRIEEDVILVQLKVFKRVLTQVFYDIWKGWPDGLRLLEAGVY